MRQNLSHSAAPLYDPIEHGRLNLLSGVQLDGRNLGRSLLENCGILPRMRSGIISKLVVQACAPCLLNTAFTPRNPLHSYFLEVKLFVENSLYTDLNGS